MSYQDGGPAFPSNPGLTIRDYFAGEALSAIIAAYIAANRLYTRHNVFRFFVLRCYEF